MWFLYAIIGALITGVGQVLAKKGQAELTPLLDNLLAAVIVNSVLVPFLLIGGVDIEAGRTVFVYALIAAAAYASFYYVISFGEVSLMVSLINTFPVVTIALAVTYLREWPNSYQWFGIVLVVLGAICISRENPEIGATDPDAES